MPPWCEGSADVVPRAWPSINGTVFGQRRGEDGLLVGRLARGASCPFDPACLLHASRFEDREGLPRIGNVALNSQRAYALTGFTPRAWP